VSVVFVTFCGNFTAVLIKIFIFFLFQNVFNLLGARIAGIGNHAGLNSDNCRAHWLSVMLSAIIEEIHQDHNYALLYNIQNVLASAELGLADSYDTSLCNINNNWASPFSLDLKSEKEDSTLTDVFEEKFLIETLTEEKIETEGCATSPRYGYKENYYRMSRNRYLTPVLWIRIRKNPKVLAGSEFEKKVRIRIRIYTLVK
jgi:hypothetical protein